MFRDVWSLPHPILTAIVPMILGFLLSDVLRRLEKTQYRSKPLFALLTVILLAMIVVFLLPQM